MNMNIYNTVQESGLDLIKELQLTGAVQDLAFSPDQRHLVAADSNRKVTLLSLLIRDILWRQIAIER